MKTKNWKIDAYEKLMCIEDSEGTITMNLKNYYRKCIALIEYGMKIKELEENKNE